MAHIGERLPTRGIWAKRLDPIARVGGAPVLAIGRRLDVAKAVASNWGRRGGIRAETLDGLALAHAPVLAGVELAEVAEGVLLERAVRRICTA